MRKLTLPMARTWIRVAMAASAVATVAVSFGPATYVEAAAASAGDPVAGAVTISPTSGSKTTLFTANPPAGSVCPGDATQQYRWQTFVMPLATDPATIAYTSSGPTGGQPLYSSTGTPMRNQASLGAGSGLITGIPANFWFNTAPISDGEYLVGFACTELGVTSEFTATSYGSSLAGKAAVWTTTLTITGGGTAYQVGTVPRAPTLTSVSPGDGQAVVTFTPGAADPAATGYTVTATPSGGGSAVTGTGSGSPITVTGLTNGTSYTFVVTGTNSVGTGAESNSQSGTPTPTPQPAPTTVTATAIPGSGVEVSWTAPAGETATRTGYSLTATPSGSSTATQTQTVGASATTYTFTGLTVGVTYVFAVTATYASPDVGTSASDTATVVPNAVLSTEVSAVRPEGALIFTQRCGVNGALSAIAAGAYDGWFADGLASETASADQVGTAPTSSGTPDPNFAEYPYPIDANGVPNPVYNTSCSVSLGTAELVTEATDPLQGTAFRADGIIHQITVVDTRNVDAGWQLAGTMGTFTDGGGNTFDGDSLGWIPVLTDDSDGTDYDQTVTSGSAVTPGTTNGLGDGALLASAAAGAGLGISVHDARLLLLIPVTVDEATYTGTLTYTLS